MSKAKTKGDRIRELMKPKKSREFTLNIDQETYEIVTKVAEETGKSRPKVLAAFIAEAYELYEKVKNDGKG